MSHIISSIVALDNVHFNHNGSCLALVDESGAGKATLLRCFNRIVVPTTGRVYVGGVAVLTREAAATKTLCPALK
jgi:ABC-type methionine transport system ATPase subunit